MLGARGEDAEEEARERAAFFQKQQEVLAAELHNLRVRDQQTRLSQQVKNGASVAQSTAAKVNAGRIASSAARGPLSQEEATELDETAEYFRKQDEILRTTLHEIDMQNKARLGQREAQEASKTAPQASKVVPVPKPAVATAKARTRVVAAPSFPRRNSEEEAEEQRERAEFFRKQEEVLQATLRDIDMQNKARLEQRTPPVQQAQRAPPQPKTAATSVGQQTQPGAVGKPAGAAVARATPSAPGLIDDIDEKEETAEFFRKQEEVLQSTLRDIDRQNKAHMEQMEKKSQEQAKVVTPMGQRAPTDVKLAAPTAKPLISTAKMTSFSSGPRLGLQGDPDEEDETAEYFRKQEEVLQSTLRQIDMQNKAQQEARKTSKTSAQPKTGFFAASQASVGITTASHATSHAAKSTAASAKVIASAPSVTRAGLQEDAEELDETAEYFRKQEEVLQSTLRQIDMQNKAQGEARKTPKTSAQPKTGTFAASQASVGITTASHATSHAAKSTAASARVTASGPSVARAGLQEDAEELDETAEYFRKQEEVLQSTLRQIDEQNKAHLAQRAGKTAGVKAGSPNFKSSASVGQQGPANHSVASARVAHFSSERRGSHTASTARAAPFASERPAPQEQMDEQDERAEYFRKQEEVLQTAMRELAMQDRTSSSQAGRPPAREVRLGGTHTMNMPPRRGSRRDAPATQPVRYGSEEDVRMPMRYGSEADTPPPRRNSFCGYEDSFERKVKTRAVPELGPVTASTVLARRVQEYGSAYLPVA